ncbi:MFS general substrate transporter [Myriangium duriaei CBS 260.36]|uniref:MFS general substrate transporter n=1 Tax=Myriangium duriaei CBS 260.36 TaxID=1168546 RepID=A0A9P4MRY8_9PEZI|nr:MFS general substrate transporter [Myriangium duriaei CBS 260.36]
MHANNEAEKPSRKGSQSKLPIEEPSETPPESQWEPHSDADSKEDDHNLDLTQTTSLADNVSLPREILFVGIICTAQLTTQAGLGQVLSVLHIIGQHFDIESNPGTLSWLISGYSLTVGSFILIAGRLGDVFGYKRMLVIGYTWAAVWSLVLGVSYYSNHVLFIFARVLQGIGPSICLPNGLALLGATYRAGKRKDMVFAIFGATAPGGAIIGSTFAALFSQVAGFWPWTFFSFSITLFALAIVGSYVIPAPPVREDIAKLSFREKLGQLDLLGGTIGITALILINFAWNQSGVVTWKEPYVYVLLIVGILLLPLFFWWEQNKSTHPLVPFNIFTTDICFVLAIIACGWGSFGIWVYYSWNFLLVVRGITPMLASAMFSPLAITGCIAALTTGVVLSRMRAAWVMTIALTAFVVGIILIGTAPVKQTYWAQTFVCTLVITFGMDMSFPAGTLIVSNALPKDRQGMGASLINTVVNYSIALALGFAGTVESQVAHGVTLKGYRGAFYMGMGLSGCGLFISLIFLARSYMISSKKGRQDSEKS